LTEEEKIALFDAYISSELSSTEKDDFEKLLAKNQDLKAEFQDYKEFAGEIHDGEQYGLLIEKLEKIHNESFSKIKSRPFILRPKFMIPVSIAACLILLVTIIKPFNTGQGDTANESSDDLQELNHEVTAYEESADIGYEEDSTYNNYASDTTPILDMALRLTNKSPKGSCFQISKKGYFITAKHLVRKKRYVKLQQKDKEIAFNAEVIYRDSLLDFAILHCSELNAENLKSVPFRFFKSEPDLGDDVFTLGYPKADIVYTTGVVSSETGFHSDSMSFQISMPSNPGYSGAPLFTQKGDLLGMVIANHSKKQSVTYILKPGIINDRLIYLKEKHDIDLSSNYTKRFSRKSDMIKRYRTFVFEVH
jgi:serine protease Do